METVNLTENGTTTTILDSIASQLNTIVYLTILLLIIV